MDGRANVLVAYASKHGSTREVAEAVAAALVGEGFAVDVRSAEAVEALASYDAVVLGGALYLGRWHGDARAFLRRHEDALAARRFAVFAMGPRTVAEDDVSTSRAQLETALARMPSVRPESVAIFGGVVDPTTLRFPFSRLPRSDARDWEAIGAWAADLADAFAAVTA